MQILEISLLRTKFYICLSATKSINKNVSNNFIQMYEIKRSPANIAGRKSAAEKTQVTLDSSSGTGRMKVHCEGSSQMLNAFLCVITVQWSRWQVLSMMVESVANILFPSTTSKRSRPSRRTEIFGMPCLDAAAHTFRKDGSNHHCNCTNNCVWPFLK